MSYFFKEKNIENVIIIKFELFDVMSQNLRVPLTNRQHIKILP